MRSAEGTSVFARAPPDTVVTLPLSHTCVASVSHRPVGRHGGRVLRRPVRLCPSQRGADLKWLVVLEPTDAMMIFLVGEMAR